MRASIAALLLAAAAVGANADETISVYRCVGADGRIALQDAPCAGDAREQTRRQVTAQPDSSPRAAPPAPVPDAMPAQTTVLIAPRAPDAELWECVDHEGRTRESMYDDPKPRYVPAWVVQRDPRAIGGLAGSLRPRRYVAPPAPQSAPAAPAPPQYQDGELLVLVTDQCHRLPPEVACVRFRERHAGMRTRIFNAPPFEGTRLKQEKAELEAILATRCG